VKNDFNNKFLNFLGFKLSKKQNICQEQKSHIFKKKKAKN